MKKLTIFKGFHFSNFFPRIYKFNEQFDKTVNISFDKSCIYNIKEKSCVNKLWGFSSGLFGVHKNSYRFGWTYDNDTNQIVIWTYLYINGRLYKKELTTCDFDTEYEFNIKITRSNNSTKVVFKFNYLYEKEFDIPIELNKCLLELGYYFGGKTRAPHKMSIFLKRDN
jgi:hypothetical protein